MPDQTRGCSKKSITSETPGIPQKRNFLRHCCQKATASNNRQTRLCKIRDLKNLLACKLKFWLIVVKEISFCRMFLDIPPREAAMSYSLKASEQFISYLSVLRRWDRNAEKREVKLESDPTNRCLLELAVVETLWKRNFHCLLFWHPGHCYWEQEI